ATALRLGTRHLAARLATAARSHGESLTEPAARRATLCPVTTFFTIIKGACGASRRTAWVRGPVRRLLATGAPDRRGIPPSPARGGRHSAVTGRQRRRSLSGGSPAGAAAATGPLARTPPGPVPRHRPVAAPARAGRPP